MHDIERAVIEDFTESCAALGAEVYGRRGVADLPNARRGFERLAARYPNQCDTWRGLAAAGDLRRDVVEHALATVATSGELVSSADVGADAVDFRFPAGYIDLPARGADGVVLACAALRAADNDFDAARSLITDDVHRREPVLAGWILAFTYYRAARWHDVRRALAPLRHTDSGDPFLTQAIAAAHGNATARLGMYEEAIEELLWVHNGPIPNATADSLLTAGLCARALGRAEQATSLINQAYTVEGLQDLDIKTAITAALSDDTQGLATTTAARIDARTDYWDPATEPGERDFARRLGATRRAELKAEATQALSDIVGMDDVKAEVAKLESNVRAGKQREALGLPVRNRSLHLVLKGPPGTGKTTVARIIGKLLCAADVLPADTFVEVGRADVVDRVIGGSEGKIKAVIDRILDSGGGVLFIDEAYSLTDSASDNDFGRLVVAELLRAMVNHADKLMVIVAGYADKMDEFLESNEGLASRFGRSIELPSYSVDELVEITLRAAAKGASVFEDVEPLRDVFTHLAAATVADTTGRPRKALDVAGNARFAETLIQFAEEERDYRLDISGKLDNPTREDLETLTAQDVQLAAQKALRRKQIDVNAAVGGAGIGG